MYGGFRKLGTPSHQCYLIGCSINYKPSSYSATPPFMETHIYLYILNPNVGPTCLWSILKCVIRNVSVKFHEYVRHIRMYMYITQKWSTPSKYLWQQTWAQKKHRVHLWKAPYIELVLSNASCIVRWNAIRARSTGSDLGRCLGSELRRLATMVISWRFHGS